MANVVRIAITGEASGLVGAVGKADGALRRLEDSAIRAGLALAVQAARAFEDRFTAEEAAREIREFVGLGTGRRMTTERLADA